MNILKTPSTTGGHSAQSDKTAPATTAQVIAHLTELSLGSGELASSASALLKLLNNTSGDTNLLMSSIMQLLQKPNLSGKDIVKDFAHLLGQFGQVLNDSNFIGDKQFASLTVLSDHLARQLSKSDLAKNKPDLFNSYSLLLSHLRHGKLSDKTQSLLQDVLQQLRSNSNTSEPLSEILSKLLSQVRQELSEAKVESTVIRQIIELSTRFANQLDANEGIHAQQLVQSRSGQQEQSRGQQQHKEQDEEVVEVKKAEQEPKRSSLVNRRAITTSKNTPSKIGNPNLPSNQGAVDNRKPSTIQDTTQSKLTNTTPVNLARQVLPQVNSRNINNASSASKTTSSAPNSRIVSSPDSLSLNNDSSKRSRQTAISPRDVSYVDNVFTEGLNTLYVFMQILAAQANSNYGEMKTRADDSSIAQKHATTVDQQIAELVKEDDKKGTRALTGDVIKFINDNHIEIKGVSWYDDQGKWQGPADHGNSEAKYNQGDLTGVKASLENYANRASDFVSQSQLQLQKLMQTYNVCVSLINSLQTMLSDMNKTISQGIR